MNMFQSKQELRELLEREQIELRSNLGQNFLIDQNLMELLVKRAKLGSAYRAAVAAARRVAS